MIEKIMPYVTVFLATLVTTLVLTPLVRELNRRLGMVDKPDARRINKVPIPRGGGVAVVLGTLVPYAIFHFVTARPWLQGISDATAYRAAILSLGIAGLGLADDKFSLPPKVKLAGQLLVAVLAWGWAGLGFRGIWPELPAGIDCVLTVFWITGAVNAFNLIDGLDGLASGLALIATLGMAGGLFFVQNPQATFFYFAFAGALIGFLRYNYNPASVFLGDSGSMFIGYTLAVLPLASHVPNSFTVSVGVPLLAMGVPIFDTSLAIVRRSLRRLLARGTKGQVMTADSDHLHHRILRSVGLNQRKAAWALYALAAGLVIVGLVAAYLQSRAAGVWLAAVALAAVVIFRDSVIELFDAGQLLNAVAHSHDIRLRRRVARLRLPFYIIVDLAILVGALFLCIWALRVPVEMRVLRLAMLVRVGAVFAGLVFFRVYRTAWARAVLSNYVRLFMACMFGSVLAAVIVYYLPYGVTLPTRYLKATTVFYPCVAFVMLVLVRIFRSIVRNLFYALDCSRLKSRTDVSRILVYGTGLRYRAFRRELVRKTAANDRMIVGLLDDNYLLRGQFIGGLRVCGTINEAPEVIRELHADAVVIACEMSAEWLAVVKGILAPTGVKITQFCLSEKSV